MDVSGGSTLNKNLGDKKTETDSLRFFLLYDNKSHYCSASSSAITSSCRAPARMPARA